MQETFSASSLWIVTHIYFESMVIIVLKVIGRYESWYVLAKPINISTDDFKGFLLPKTIDVFEHDMDSKFLKDHSNLAKVLDHHVDQAWFNMSRVCNWA